MIHYRLQPDHCKRLLLILGLAVMLHACSEEPPPISDAVAERTMTGFFRALSEADTTLLMQITTEDFTLYEHDEVWNRDSLLSLMPSVQGRIWEIQDAEVYVEHDLAHIHYYNISRQPQGRSWLESALLIREGEDLRIAFMHSTKLYLTEN